MLTLPSVVEEAVAEEVTLELGLKAITGGHQQRSRKATRCREDSRNKTQEKEQMVIISGKGRNKAENLSWDQIIEGPCI